MTTEMNMITTWTFTLVELVAAAVVQFTLPVVVVLVVEAVAAQFMSVVVEEEAAAAAVQSTLEVEAAAAAVRPSPLGADLLEVVLWEDPPPLEVDLPLLAPEQGDPLPPEQAWAWMVMVTTQIWKGSRRSTSPTMAI